MTTKFSATGLFAGYGRGRPCVRDVDIELGSGQVMALLGPNGAGKTTLLLTLAGLLAPLGGSMELDGQPVGAGNARAASKAGIVLVPDDRSLFKSLTVVENLRLARRKDGPTIDEVIEYFPALGERRSIAAGMLSGGEQQMLALGRAFVQAPKVLLVDELSMGLAPVVVESLLPVVRSFADERNAAVVLVEQHVHMALSVADHAMVLRHGEVTTSGPAAELAASPHLLEQAYLGESAGADSVVF
ncbi:ATP-binding cassette domain-containing protein [Rhodococcus rhodochrous]|uniref:ATP-binding cassette domain-containing protein n=1 Tax=Rhodococcus rhodochrous TaxID=1829 RepID=A0AAW4XHX4_RHORH|nr:MULTISPECIES: ATP-binding cassette domain-containing protein [Rhodococcus]MCD2113168.1 ATP-binding cassette domain-containing protein [Rhodococcus rhodochrous]WAL48680.1 ATP-binding cassette domain-containing protein [Rhodococcus pyridinivorans]